MAIHHSKVLPKPLRKEYQGLLDAEGEAALANLNKQFGGSNLLNAIRNNFSFHHPSNETVEAAFQAAIDDPDLSDVWNLYISQFGFNTFYFMSDLIFAHGIGKHAGTNLVEAQHKIMREVNSAVQNMFEFTKAFTAAAWLKNFGETMDAKKQVFIKDAPNVDQPTIPFFVEMEFTKQAPSK